MKVIDLLNKIAKGEEVPKKIKYKCDTYILNENELHSNLTYMDEKKDDDGYSKYLFQDWIIDAILNEEVEIIEEVEEDEFEDIEEVDNITPYYRYYLTINSLIKNQKKIIEQLNYTEELESEIEHLKEEMKYREQDIEDNYKRIRVEDQL